MKIFAIKVIMNKEFWRGLKYYLDKDKEKGVKVAPGGLIRDSYLDSKFFTREIDDDLIAEKLLDKGPTIAKINGYKTDNIPDMYAYAVSLYGEVLKVYEVRNQSNPEKAEVISYDMREFYRNQGLSNEEIDEGNRRLAICGIRDGVKEAKDCLIIALIALFARVIVYLGGNVSESKEILNRVGFALDGAIVFVIGGLLYNIKKILHHLEKLLNGLEPSKRKRKVLSKNIFRYLRREEIKEEKKRQ